MKKNNKCLGYLIGLVLLSHTLCAMEKSRTSDIERLSSPEAADVSLASFGNYVARARSLRIDDPLIQSLAQFILDNVYQLSIFYPQLPDLLQQEELAGLNQACDALLALQPRSDAIVSFSHSKAALRIVVTLNEDTIIAGSDDNTLHLWDIPSQQCIRTFKGHTGAVSAALIHEGKLISGSADKTIRIWDITSGECLQILQGHNSIVYALERLDRTHVISASADKTIRVWDLRTGLCVRTLDHHARAVRSLVKIEDSLFASASEDKDTRITIFDLANHPHPSYRIKDINNSTDTVFSLCYLGDRVLASSCADSSILISGITTGNTLNVLKGHTGTVYCLTKIDDKTFASGSADKTIRIWNRSGNCLNTFYTHGAVKSITAVNPYLLIAATEGGIISIINLRKPAISHILAAAKSNFLKNNLQQDDQTFLLDHEKELSDLMLLLKKQFNIQDHNDHVDFYKGRSGKVSAQERPILLQKELVTVLSNLLKQSSRDHLYLYNMLKIAAMLKLDVLKETISILVCDAVNGVKLEEYKQMQLPTDLTKYGVHAFLTGDNFIFLLSEAMAFQSDYLKALVETGKKMAEGKNIHIQLEQIDQESLRIIKLLLRETYLNDHKLSRPSSAKRVLHRRTVLRLVRNCRAMALSDWPSAEAKTMRQRSATCCGVPCALSHCPTCCCWLESIIKAGIFRDMPKHKPNPVNCPSICWTLH